jgi:hypothetical protein
VKILFPVPSASRWTTVIIAAWLLGLPVPCMAAEGTISGAVSAGGAGQAGIAIEVYLEARRSAGGTPFAVTESGEGGRFEISLPAGSYYLWAKGRPPAFGPPLVSEYPGNPVGVSAGKTTVLAPFTLREAGGGTLAAAPPQTGVRGRVVADGGPAADVAVNVYGESAARLTGPGYVASVLSGPDGSFQADLPPGKYRVAARRRSDGAAAGFLRAGDLTGEHPGNPVAVAAGSYTDIGDLQLHAVDPRRLAEAERERRGGGLATGVAGTVVGPDGNPLAGQHVFLYRDEGMIGRPELMAVSGKDGSFAVALPEGGIWFVGARSTMGGPRQPGEMAGKLSGSPDSSVAVRSGERKSGLVIRMEVAW